MVTNAKDKTLSHREIKSLFSVLIIQVMTTGNRDFLVSIFFRHRELKALFIFSSHHLPPTSIHLKALFMNKKQIINN